MDAKNDVYELIGKVFPFFKESGPNILDGPSKDGIIRSLFHKGDSREPLTCLFKVKNGNAVFQIRVYLKGYHNMEGGLILWGEIREISCETNNIWHWNDYNDPELLKQIIAYIPMYNEKGRKGYFELRYKGEDF